MVSEFGDLSIREVIRRPCEHAFYGNHDIISKRVDCLQETLPIGLDVLVQPDLSRLIVDAEIHFFRMQVDSAIKLVPFGVESHPASYFGLGCFGDKDILSRFTRRP